MLAIDAFADAVSTFEANGFRLPPMATSCRYRGWTVL